MRRFRSLAVLLVGMALIASTPVLSQEKAKTESPKTEAKKTDTAPKADPKDAQILELKKSVELLKGELEATKKGINESTAKAVDAVSKKADDALKASKDASETSAKALQASSAPAPVPAGLGEMKKALEESGKALEEVKKSVDAAKAAGDEGKDKGDTAWMLVSSALVMFMLPGLALFYGGMVRRKNMLATMMQSMACLAVVGLYWIAVGYSLAFGPSVFTLGESGGLLGWSWDLFFLKGINTDTKLPALNIPVYAHVLFQGMFAIITPALISGALAERIRFWPFVIFCILWVTFVYCPLAHMVWAFDWFYEVPIDAAKGLGGTAVGYLGKMGALDFAGGTVVHIAAGVAGFAACLVLRRRDGYPKTVIHPSGMVLTLLGAGLLWFGWFGFNGGSSGGSNPLAVSAFAATQAAAAAAGLAWMLIEWLHKGKPTALGLASGIVAGLVAVTPASGYVYIWGGVFIGLAASLFCYIAVWLKSLLGYDDSLDAFGVHGVGGFLGAVLTGLFCYTSVNSAGADGFFAIRGQASRLVALDTLIPEAEKAAAAEADTAKKEPLTKKVDDLKAEQTKIKDLVAAREKDEKGPLTQTMIQLKACLFSGLFALVISVVLALLTHVMTLGNFTTDKESETEGLDRTEHGEVGFDFGYTTESINRSSGKEPISASKPKMNGRFELLIEGADAKDIALAWTSLCQPKDTPHDPNFLAIYPHITTFSGNSFRCRGEDHPALAARMEALFKKLLPGKPIRVVTL
jgi:ammonium transporter, Amt family